MAEQPDISPMETEGGTTNLRNEVHLAMAGKSGAGKSTVASNIFGVKMKVELSADAITTESKTTSATTNGITVYITDTVGLQEGKGKQRELRKLAKHLKKNHPKVDLLIYCLSVDPSSKFTDGNPEIMKNLQYAYGSKIWENCILALTFSNYAWNRCKTISEQSEGALTQDAAYNKHITAYIDKFKKELIDKLKVDVNVEETIDFPPTPPQRDPLFERTILAIPVGDEPDDQVLPKFTKHRIPIKTTAKPETIPIRNWRDVFFLTAVFKCKSNIHPSLLKYNYGSVIRGIVGFGVVGGVGGIIGGAGIGAAAGAAVGCCVSPLVGPAAPVVIGMGAGFGAVIGALVAAPPAAGIGTGIAIINAKDK